jgi:hypothetical protein
MACRLRPSLVTEAQSFLLVSGRQFPSFIGEEVSRGSNRRSGDDCGDNAAESLRGARSICMHVGSERCLTGYHRTAGTETGGVCVCACVSLSLSLLFLV